MFSIAENKEEEIHLPFELCEFYEDKHQKLGSGSFSSVLLAEHMGTGELVAVKVMDKKKMKKENNLYRFYSEAEALKSLVHQNICQLYQVYECEEYLCLVLEHCSGGELFDYIVSRKKLKEDEARRLFREMLAAMSFIHEKGYAHRDIKPENMLLSFEKGIKLIDFGFSVKPANGLNVPLMTRVGSPAYAAPELVSGGMYFGNEADIWSLGVVLYAVLCGFLPFDKETTDQLFESIKNDTFPIPKHLSKGSEKLIKEMLEKNPKKRITMEKLLEHEWVTNNNECPSVTSKSTLNMNELDLEIVEEVANAVQVTHEDVAESISMMKYDDTMAYYLLLSRKKKKDIWKFNQLFGLNKNLPKTFETQGSFFRQRSQTENKETWRQKMSEKRDEDRSKTVGRNQLFEAPRSAENQIRSRSTTIKDTKPRSGSRFNEFVSLVFKHEEKPRKAKGFYQMENTSTKSAEEIHKELLKVLNHLCSNNYIDSYINSKRFLFRCTTSDKEGKKMTFELEICAIPKVQFVLGIRNKRISGDAWLYKEVIEQILSLIKL